MLNVYKGIDVYMTNHLVILYEDDIVIVSETAAGLHNGFDIKIAFCECWKLTVNLEQTNVMVFRKAGILLRTVSF